MFYRVYCLLIKELLAIWQDPKSRFIIIGPPLIQLIVFSFAATLEVKNIELAVMNQDQGSYSNELIQRLDGSSYFTKIRFVETTKQVTELLDNQKVLAAVLIASDFSRDISKGNTGVVQILLDGRNTNSTQIVNSYINEIVYQYNQEILQKKSSHVQPTRLVVRHWFNPNLNFKWFIVPSLFVTLLTISGVIITGLSIAREREMGTLEQLMVSPITPSEMLLGKTLPALIICLIQAVFLYLISIYIFKIPFVGSIIYLVLCTIVYLTAVISVGLFISSVSATQQQAILGAFVFIVPAILLSGFATPIENMPAWLQSGTIVNPIKYFLVIVKGLYLKNLPFSIIWSSLYPLIIITLVTMSLSVMIFKRRIG